ncbi:MAG: PEP-CTERM/exosortase system-associated acyltransferase [Nitrospirae bacterium]|nr:PEP-CTERM/exosortase system-associated acyltransferase [Nitrospirota bacterium]
MKFIAFQAANDEDLKEIHKLRYKVYVEEWGFEKAHDHPKGAETDEYDDLSVHFLTRDDKGQLVGTVRLILPTPAGFPIEKHCEISVKTDDIPREKLAEISRLAISKTYRKRVEDKYIFGPDEERRTIGNFDPHAHYMSKYRRTEDTYRFDAQQTRRVLNERRVRPETVLSLYRAVYHESKRRGITHWYAVMTKGLYVLLKKLGIHFQPIGDPVDYHGIRTPYMGDIKKIEDEVAIKDPELYKDFMEGL